MPPSRPSTTTPEVSGSEPCSSRSWRPPSPSAQADQGVGKARQARSVPDSPPSSLGNSTSARPTPGSPWSPASVPGSGPSSGAPLGGAVLATEILYRDDFDAEALLPSFVASLIGYVIFGAFIGFTPLFGFAGSYHFTDPAHLAVVRLDRRPRGPDRPALRQELLRHRRPVREIPLPRWVKPAIGGVIVGLIALAIPEVLGTGYGWIQQSLGHQLLTLPLWIVLMLPFARILATGLSIGSGGFGGNLRAGNGHRRLHRGLGLATLRAGRPLDGPQPCSVRDHRDDVLLRRHLRAPLAVMLMVAEMTGSLSILGPAMIAVGLAWFIVRRSDDTIYRSQLRTRADAPAGVS